MIPQSSVRVLVVEDDPALLETIRDGFIAFGFETFTATNGEDAWLSAQENSPDVVISDIRMPKENGVQLLERLKTKNPRRPKVILISAYSDYTVDELLNRGADGVFQKPFRSQVIKETIERAALEPSARWAKRPAQPVARLYEKSIEDFHVALRAGAVSFGRGGIFFEQNDSLPQVGDMVEFKIHIKEGYPCPVLHGIGRIPWVRNQADSDLPAGFGVELEYLDDICRDRYVNWLKTIRIQSFIPNC